MAASPTPPEFAAVIATVMLLNDFDEGTVRKADVAVQLAKATGIGLITAVLHGNALGVAEEQRLSRVRDHHVEAIDFIPSADAYRR
jgi:hypothetical protein